MKKYNVDAVLVSDARTEQLRQITQQAIDSIGKRVNVIVIESNPSVRYPEATVIHPNVPFNYNAYLNLGARAGSAAFIFFGNNDLIFTENWEEALVHTMVNLNVHSASPICPSSHAPFNIKPDTGVRFGNKVFQFFCGWAFMWTRDLFNQLGGLNEDFTFWCSDNVTVQQLTAAAQPHMLVTSSTVHHLAKGSNTINLVDSDTTYKYTVEEIKKYNARYNSNIRIDRGWQLPANLKTIK